MNTRDRFLITIIICLTILAAVWLHGTLTRYEVLIPDDTLYYSVRYDRMTGRVWVVSDRWTQPLELGVKRVQPASAIRQEEQPGINPATAPEGTNQP